MMGAMLGASLWEPIVRRAIVGRWGRLKMAPAIDVPFPVNLGPLGLYLHVPFCRKLCPYCPYNRFVYSQSLFEAYERAVCGEIELYAPYLNGTPISSLYIGGGTPTVDLAGLVRILRRLKSQVGPIGDICVELHPGFMDTHCLAALRELGVNMVSIGVESTSDRMLQFIGRTHNAQTALDAVRRARSQGFETVNADLLFALPTQTPRQWRADVVRVLDAGAHQLSTYPLFSFPYSDFGRRQRLARVRQPPARSIRAMLDDTDGIARQRGLHRCAVWSWIEAPHKKFSSVSRHHYIGFGPSASSMIGSHFYVNTFDVDAYASALPGRRPIALVMPMGRRMEMAYWVYWRAYELFISDAEFRGMFGTNQSLVRLFGPSFAPLQAAGLMKRTRDGYRITHRGAYWIHRLQNLCTLSYIDHLWGRCRSSAWPQEVVL